MPEPVVWSEDKCTCKHSVSQHKNGDGRCAGCDEDTHWGVNRLCTRFQWDGQARRRTW